MPLHDPSTDWLAERARAATQLVSWKITFYMPCIMTFLIKETISLCREEFILSGVATYTHGVWSVGAQSKRGCMVDRHTNIPVRDASICSAIFIFPASCPRSAHNPTDCIASARTQIAKRRGCRFALVQFQVAWWGGDPFARWKRERRCEWESISFFNRNLFSVFQSSYIYVKYERNLKCNVGI